MRKEKDKLYKTKRDTDHRKEMEAVRCCEGNEASTSLNGGLNGRIGPRGSCVHMQAFKHSGGLEMAKPVMQYLCICRHHILGPSPVPVPQPLLFYFQSFCSFFIIFLFMFFFFRGR